MNSLPSKALRDYLHHPLHPDAKLVEISTNDLSLSGVRGVAFIAGIALVGVKVGN